MNSTFDDPILADLYRFRERCAAACNGDVMVLMEELIREQDELEKEGRRFESYPPLQPEFPYLPIDEAPPLTTPPVAIPGAQPDSPATAE